MSAAQAPAKALAVLDEFTAAFNRQDATGMDATLHFPHVYVFPGKKLVVWERSGSMSADFFPELIGTGWAFSRYTKREPLLVTPERVHFLVEYERCRTDGSVLSKQAAVWIVACIDGRWGIQVRSNE